MRFPAAALATVLLSGAPAVAQICTETSGTVYCPNGVTGFRDSSGNLWIGKGRQGTVILNMDDTDRDQESPSRKRDRGSFIIELCCSGSTLTGRTVSWGLRPWREGSQSLPEGHQGEHHEPGADDCHVRPTPERGPIPQVLHSVE